MNELIRSYERLDDLERSGLKIIQNANKFCFGMDAVLLTGFVKIRNGEKTLDLGTGTGIIPILLSAKTKGLHFTGLEIQEDMADMASRSVKYNKLEEKIQIINGDIKEYKSLFSSSSFDVVTSNPPYMNDLHGIKNTESSLAIARHEISCSLEDVIKAAAYVLKANGKFFMVHRPHRLIDIISTLRKHKLEPKRMCFVHPFLDKDANMVMIEALKGGGSFLKLEPPIVVYESQGVYTKQIYDIYGY
jgi:ribosomal protein L11 methyltransferase (prmA)